jgi:hypothetical protein
MCPMRSALRMRHYCDHCKKSGALRPQMLRHEQRCTLNPARQCRVCEIGGFGPKPLAELIALAKALQKEFKQLDEGGLKALTEAADGCPGCVLAAHRQAGVYSAFDFKEAMKPIWDEINAERSAIVGGVAW